MSLPHPHGSASGQIGHNSIYDTGVTPGSTGGKFIGFGEEGTTAVANRTHWALSENIDHVYQSIAADMAVPAGYNRTSPGGGESSYQFPTGEDIWVGDNTYPGSAGASDPEGMEMLFGVFDANFNELQDVNGDEVRVKMVRNAAGVTDVYQGGSPFLDSFQDQPIVYFMTVDSSGTPVTDPYTIPAATDYKIMCGIKSNLESLPTDALIRFKVQSASEVQAGAFLQDGTRKMTGDADWDSNKLLNPTEITGPTATDLLVHSLQDLTLQGDRETLLKDQHLSAVIPLSQTGISSLYQPASAKYSSVVGALGSQARVGEALTFNRSLDRTGSFTPTAGTAVNFPALKLILGGEYVEIPASSVSAATGSGTYHMCVSPSGVVSLRETGVPPGVPSGSVIIWTGSFDGATVWSNTADLRWPSIRQGNIVSVYVGDMAGVDFTSLDDAGDWMSLAGYATDTVKPEIIICGTATLNSTMWLGGGWTLRGLSMYGDSSKSVIQTSTTFTTTENVISTNDGCIVKDILFEWMNSSAHQAATAYGIYGTYNCVFENLKFRGGTYDFYNCIYVRSSGNQGGSIIRNCDFDNWTNAAIRCAARAVIENCTFKATNLGKYAIDAIGTGAATSDETYPDVRIRDCVFSGSPTDAYIAVTGPNTLIEGCSGNLTGAVAVTCPFVTVLSASVSQVRGGVTVKNCNVQNGYRFFNHDISNSSLKAHVVIENNNISDFGNEIFEMNNTALSNGSSFHIRNNNISGCSGRIGYWKECYHVIFSGNKITDHTSFGIDIRENTQATIDGNWFEGWGANWLITMPSGLTTGCKIINNYMGPQTHSGSGLILVDSPNTLISGNDIRGGATSDLCLVVRSENCRIIGNSFAGYRQSYVHVDNVYAVADNGVIADNTFDAGLDNADSYAVKLINYAKNWSIKGNVFWDIPRICIGLNHAFACSVANNTIQGATLGDHSDATAAIYASSLSRMINISGNVLQDLGPNGGTAAMIGILCEAPNSIVSGNSIRGMIGSGHGLTGGTIFDTCVGIVIDADNVSCVGNFFHHQLGLQPDPFYYVHGVEYRGGTGGTLVGNCSCIEGVTGNPGGMSTGTKAITGGAGPLSVVGNSASGIANSGSADWSFYLPTTEGVLVGNVAENSDADLGDNTKAISIGNALMNTGGVLNLAVFPTNTAYNVNTSNPRDDLNRKM